MRLYHGSNIRITEVDLTKSKPHKDFGKGFYLTPDYQRAVAMAGRTVAIDGGEPTVTPFIFNQSQCSTDVKIKVFKGYTAEWALFILENRDKSHEFKHGYDIVIGPVADARVDYLLSKYKQSFGEEYANPNNLELLARELAFTGPAYTQFCFCTPLGTSQLMKD